MRDSLGGSTVNDTQIVLTEEIVEVTLVDHHQRDLRIELAKTSNLAVLLRDQSLVENGEFDEEATLGQVEVRSKAADGYALLIPVQGELQGFVHPLKAIQGEQLREELFARVSKGLSNAGYHARMATTRVVAP
jgi:hypothetical protein